MKEIFLTLISVFLFTQLLNANHSEIKQKKTVTDTLNVDGIDPVCKMKVKAGQTKTIIFKKVNYGFCSEGCKKSFVANPKKYLNK